MAVHLARPGGVLEARRFGDVLELVAAEVAIEDRPLRAIGMQVSGERVEDAFVGAAVALLVERVLADVGDEEIEQAVAVVVEEDRARRVAVGSFDAGLGGDVGEVAVTVVLEEQVSVADAGDEEVGIAVVVDVRERRADARATAVDGQSARLGDVLEAAAAEVFCRARSCRSG